MHAKRKQTRQLPINDSKKTHLHSEPNNDRKTPVWKFSKIDFEHERWGFTKQKDLLTILHKLKSFEGMTLAEIKSQSGGRRRGSNSHYIPAEILCREAQQRFTQLNLEEFSDNIFSLRLKGTERIFAILQGNEFELLWHDNDHEICPAIKKHT